MRILAYKRGLASVAALRDAGCRVLYPTSRPRRGRVCHAWGVSAIPDWAHRVKWINHPAATKLVSDKKNWANFCGQLDTPYALDFTEDKEVAQRWAAEKGTKVVCRTLLNASSGKGIVIARNSEQVVDAPLYSRYFKKTSEYRIIYSHALGHVMVASKRRPQGVEMDRDELLIRSLDSGYVYQTEAWGSIPSCVRSAVSNMSHHLKCKGLELLAYDVVYNSETNEAKIVEANTAPGLNDESAALVTACLKELERRMK